MIFDDPFAKIQSLLSVRVGMSIMPVFLIRSSICAISSYALISAAALRIEAREETSRWTIRIATAGCVAMSEAMLALT